MMINVIYAMSQTCIIHEIKCPTSFFASKGTHIKKHVSTDFFLFLFMLRITTHVI